MWSFALNVGLQYSMIPHNPFFLLGVKMINELELVLKIKATWHYHMSVQGLLSGEPYSVWQSPDGKLEVQIHDVDNELVCIHVVETDRWLLNPRDIIRILGET